MYSSSLRSFHFPALMMASLLAAGCQANTGAERCWIHGPEQLMPAAAKRVQPGMSMAELERLLGVADYSPSEGQFYFSTGGDCPLDAGERTASCGLVADFRLYMEGQEPVLTAALRSCWWGAIAG